MSYQDRLKHLKLPSLAHRRRRGDIIQCFKIIKGLDDIPCERFFTFAESRTRGHCYKLIKPRCETSFRLRSFSQQVITDWNSLPYDIVNAQTLNSFKNKVDKFWSGKDIRAATIQLPHDTLRITIFASQYDMYRDTFLTTLEP